MRWVKISANPLFCQRYQVTDRAEGGWVWGILFLLLFQSNILSKVYSGYPEYQSYLQIFWSIFTKKYLFLHKAFIFKKALKNQNWIYFSPPPVCPVNWKKSIICSYSATGLRNPTEHLWSWHFSLTSSSAQDPRFQWHLPVSALTRNTNTTTARGNYLPSWAVSININNCSA